MKSSVSVNKFKTLSRFGMYRWILAIMGGSLIGVTLFAADTARVGEGIDFGFEGTIDRLDLHFAPDLREGLVISGVYALMGSLEIADTDPALDKAVFPDAVGDVDLTIDRNHVWVYGARSGMGESSLELVSGVESAGQRFDLYALTLPLDGLPLGDAGWKPRWLQLWLYGPEGEVFTRLEPQPPPATFMRGWWRITFWNEEGTESALIEGRLSASGEAGEPLTPGDQVVALEGVIVELGRQLDEATQRTGALAAELRTTRHRIEGLQSTLDVLIEEREHLRSELAQLQARQMETPTELERRIAEMEAQEALWQERELDWKGQNRVLAEALSDSEIEVARLKRALERIEDEPSGRILSETTRDDEIVAPPSRGTVLVIPRPDNVIESRIPLTSTVPIVQAASVPVMQSSASTVLPIPEEASNSSPRRPGKFRRGNR